MVNRPSQPEIITVNSETLQSQIRDLLPSQNGFGSELQASNVITPIIDLTAAAEGSGLPTLLQNALAFGSQTAFDVTNTTTQLANSPGFYRVVGSASMRAESSPDTTSNFSLSDGVTTKVVWALPIATASSTVLASVSFDLVFWLASGESLFATTNSDRGFISGSIRQIANSSGTLTNPSGYPL